MTEKPSDSIKTISAPPGSTAPLPGQGTGGCGGLIMGVAVMLIISVVVTVIGYMIVRAIGWV